MILPISRKMAAKIRAYILPVISYVNQTHLLRKILKAENQAFQDDRLKHAASLDQLTSSLYRTCERLERAESNGKDFVRILRREIRKFRKLQHKWMMTL